MIFLRFMGFSLTPCLLTPGLQVGMSRDPRFRIRFRLRFKWFWHFWYYWLRMLQICKKRADVLSDLGIFKFIIGLLLILFINGFGILKYIIGLLLVHYS